MNGHVEKLALVRAALKQISTDAYIIPLSDPHLGESIHEHWNIIHWLTGFTGSAAVVVITDTLAGLWTDSRYFIQAEEQLRGTGFTLMKPKSLKPVDYIDWMEENIPDGSKIAFDGKIFPLSSYRRLEHQLGNKKIVINTEADLISGIWHDRPKLPSAMVWEQGPEYSGKERSRKMADVRAEMKKKNVDLHLLNSAEDIMWLLNIRGNDLEYSPLCLSFALLSEKQILLFVDEKKIPLNIASEFARLGIVILPYEEIEGFISSLHGYKSILINPATTSVSLFNSIPSRLRIIEDTSIPGLLKSRKNKTECANIQDVMIKDGVALSRFFYWFEKNSGIVPMSELSVARRLEDLRKEQPDFLGPSFRTIIAFNEHAALPHYTANSESDATIREKGILLVDSGGHYMGGTTDITRTITLGNPTPQQKKDFTLVLKGHIALAKAKFPYGTRGQQLDIMARKALWDNGLNYGHGTGHGVGYCLNVHEGPQSVSPSDSKTPIEEGMLISNEPGIYRQGEYGIRTENLMICFADEETEFGCFLKFETVSLCYIDISLIDRSLLDENEIVWLNSYHSDVFERLSRYLSLEERSWLQEKTAALG